MRFLWASLSVASLCLAGCAGTSGGNSSTPAGVASVAFHGLVHGGQQPVSGSTIQLYQAGTTGYGAGATALLTVPVLTDANGSFNITGDYTPCTSGSQIYITATGGDPLPGVPNSAINLIAGLGLCGNVLSSTNITINEVTTVATVYALAPFMSGINIGSSSTNAAGLASAFTDIATLVNTSTGVAKASTPGVALPTAVLDAIANSLAACINTSGPTSTGCNNLFTAAPNANSSLPTDTVTAAINIARNPGRNVTAILNNASSFVVFNPTVATANDLTLAVTYSGSQYGFNSPAAAAIDATGNIWVANSAGNSVTEVSHDGAVLSGSTGYTAGGLSSPSAIAFDLSGNAWLTNKGNNSLTELSSTGTSVGSSPFTGGGLALPTGIAFDALGNSWISNSGANVVSEFSASGVPVSSTGYTVSGINAPVGVAINPH